MKKSIAIVVCMHGNERVGLFLKKRLGHTGVPVFIGNPKALKKDIRFIEKDLNRVFPGNSKGCYEEKRAAKILNKLKKFDIVIDIHSSSNKCPLFGIITKPSKEKILIAQKMGLKKLAIMPEKFAKNGSLIDNIRCGISLEIGPHKAKKNVKQLTKTIKNLIQPQNKEVKMKIYEIFDIIHKNSEDKASIRNFKKVKKGYPLLKNRQLLAIKNFTPILVEEEAYKNVLCLAAKKI